MLMNAQIAKLVAIKRALTFTVHIVAVVCKDFVLGQTVAIAMVVTNRV